MAFCVLRFYLSVFDRSVPGEELMPLDMAVGGNHGAKFRAAAHRSAATSHSENNSITGSTLMGRKRAVFASCAGLFLTRDGSVEISRLFLLL